LRRGGKRVEGGGLPGRARARRLVRVLCPAPALWAVPNRSLDPATARRPEFLGSKWAPLMKCRFLAQLSAHTCWMLTVMSLAIRACDRHALLSLSLLDADCHVACDPSVRPIHVFRSGSITWSRLGEMLRPSATSWWPRTLPSLCSPPSVRPVLSALHASSPQRGSPCTS